jgi:DHA1 family inner membrane transport protein
VARPARLLALALGGFGIGLTEFGTIGLLPQNVLLALMVLFIAGNLLSAVAPSYLALLGDGSAG